MVQTRKLNVSKEAFAPGDAKTCTASGAITGSRFVKVVTGGIGGQPKVAQCTAAARVWGVCQWDTADTYPVSVLREGAYGVKAGAAITGGQEVESDATGQAIPLAAGKSAGVALHDAASGAIVYISMSV